MTLRADLAGQPVIIGSGIAGLVCALELAARRPVVLVTAADAGAQSATRWAQGGMAAAVGADDSPALHARDTRAAGDGLTDPAAADWLTRAAPDVVAWLAARGVRFDGGASGPALGLEAAHSRRRILHAAGDGTGAEIIRALTAALDRHPRITVIAGAQARRLLTRDGRIAGVIAVTATGALTLPATQVVLATGSIGGLYRDATSPGENWGQGLAMAAQAGAALRDLEFVQFHPTALDGPARPMPLISEAVRGEGAVLIDETGTRFATALPGAELAPRDRLARAIAAHLAKGHRVFLDATACPGPGFARRFPGIDAICRQAGIDPTRQPIPVRPAMHYHMGGIATDLTGRSSLPGLWACGEAACTGLHGANRLASNSLTEAAVLARAVAADIAAQPPAPPLLALTTDDAPPPADPAPARSIVSDQLGLVRDAQGLRHAIAALLPVAQGDGPARAPAQLALMMAVAAHDRCESRGAHTRRDHPATAALARHSTLTLGAALARAADLTPQPLTEST
ncbi:L-aspartate oxidase [Paracoccus jiaweipingae]|uniref:L-aspartate oxidase n=1 Tax=unclassified Paracoccus (in: a-proteobacteria) TaxID=2688777 RepID=UPI003799BC8F